jgi:hypothetical protein
MKRKRKKKKNGVEYVRASYQLTDRACVFRPGLMTEEKRRATFAVM